MEAGVELIVGIQADIPLRICSHLSMRDRRFIAAHRGGPLDMASHRKLAAWAALCAERAVERFCEDERPRLAVAAARAWARGEVKPGFCMNAAVTSHAAAREAKTKESIAAARAAGHAAATAHAADHSLGAALYAAKAADNPESELDWQIAHAPPELRALIASAIGMKLEAVPGFLGSKDKKPSA